MFGRKDRDRKALEDGLEAVRIEANGLPAPRFSGKVRRGVYKRALKQAFQGATERAEEARAQNERALAEMGLTPQE